jgi:hypothetical protein
MALLFEPRYAGQVGSTHALHAPSLLNRNLHNIVRWPPDFALRCPRAQRRLPSRAVTVTTASLTVCRHASSNPQLCFNCLFALNVLTTTRNGKFLGRNRCRQHDHGYLALQLYRSECNTCHFVAQISLYRSNRYLITGMPCDVVIHYNCPIGNKGRKGLGCKCKMGWNVGRSRTRKVTEVIKEGI